MSDQLPLFPSSEEARRLRRALLKGARAVVERVGVKVVAPELNKSPSGLLDCLEERERHSLSLRELCEILARDERGEIVEELCAALGYEEPVRRPVLTAEQELEIMKAEVAKCGTAGEGILGRCRARGVKV